MVNDPPSGGVYGRALLTDREREILESDSQVHENYYHVVVTRVRNRIERLSGDIEALESHHSLAEELRDVVCGGSQ